MDILHYFMSFIINFGNKQTDHRMEGSCIYEISHNLFTNLKGSENVHVRDFSYFIFDTLSMTSNRCECLIFR